ncbi:LysR family transcriptional regulator [Massilia sp. TS11]|uniref:LysR family transcriptional regulator n=1 Tax=Massilia sp. TS11 TaxID=2908003 RepID=UPI001EDB08DB|nr:LysR family transcriptional regulator [Massilia sp. TS11]MCG2586201.1 LysR family transcriptional regulator [Massilia sp. TS11]
MSLPGRPDLNDLAVFAAVADSGGFAAAAQRLGVAPAKVSVEVARLEKQLGLALFTRTTRKVVLTEAGAALYAEAAPLLSRLWDAMEAAPGAPGVLRGSLRIATSVEHAAQSLAPAVAAFARLHPELQIDLRSSDRVVDLVEEGIDVAIRMGWLRDSSLRAVRLRDFEQYVVAAPAYLQGRPLPQRPEDLLALDWLALSLLRTPLSWTFSAPDGSSQVLHLRSRLRVDSPSTLRALLAAGAGVSVLEEFSLKAALASGELVRLLPAWRLPTGGVFAVFPPGRQLPRKVQAFVDFYRAWLAQA